jgi:hypothetical protein
LVRKRNDVEAEKLQNEERGAKSEQDIALSAEKPEFTEWFKFIPDVYITMVEKFPRERNVTN